MYERFYGFEERPFTLLPDPDFLFLSEKHRTALDLLELAIFNSSGFCVISGEIGAGKTTLVRELLNRLDESINVGLISNTHESFGELLQWVMAAYGLPLGSSDKLELHRRFIDYTIEQYASNKHTLLIVDEAQNLSISALEELRMLSNVNSDKDLVLQVILVGQQQLRDKLKSPKLEQFSQRIALDYHLDTLNEEETREYIQHRLQRAGGRRDLFSDSACIVVYRVTHGIPRLINRVCDLSLVYGYSKESLRISAEVVEQVAEDQRMGRLFGEQEIALDQDIQQPVELKAVASGYDRVAEPQAKTRTGHIDPQLQDAADVPVGSDKSAGPDSGEVVVNRSVATAAERQAEELPEAPEKPLSAESATSDTSVTINTNQSEQAENKHVSDSEAIAGVALDQVESENCEPVHTSSTDGGLLSEATEEAKEPQVTEEHQAPMKNEKSKPVTAENVMSGKSEAIVEAMSSILLPEAQSDRATAADVQSEKSNREMADDLHTLIVNAEKKQRTKGERGAMWLLVGVAVMVVGTGWMARDIWLDQFATVEQQAVVKSESTLTPIKRDKAKAVVNAGAPQAAIEPVAEVIPTAEIKPADAEVMSAAQVAAAETEVVAKSAPDVASTEDKVTTDPAPAAVPVVEAAAALESGERLVQQADGSLVNAAVTAAPEIDPLQQDAELQHEAERLARLQKEAQRLEEERKAAERKLAKQRAARQALERKARLERQRIKAAKKQVDKVAVERKRVEAQLNRVTQTPVVKVVPAAVADTASQVTAPVEKASTVAVLEPAEIKKEGLTEREIKFSNNPCNGPTAKFMSTCR